MPHLEGKRRDLGFSPSQNYINLVFRNERIIHCFTCIRIFLCSFSKVLLYLCFQAKPISLAGCMAFGKALLSEVLHIWIQVGKTRDVWKGSSRVECVMKIRKWGKRRKQDRNRPGEGTREWYLCFVLGRTCLVVCSEAGHLLFIFCRRAVINRARPWGWWSSRLDWTDPFSPVHYPEVP